MNSKELFAELEARPESWRKEVLYLYNQGASDREVMCEIGLTPLKWASLYDDLSTEFAEVVDLGRVLQQAWWESQGRKNLNNKNFNAALWTINMKNRFGWSEKTEQSLTNIDLKNADDQELIKQIKALNQRLGLRDLGTL